MSLRLRNWCNLILSFMVLYLSASSILPEEPGPLHQIAVFQNKQAPKFLHLLAEVTEEVSEEESEHHPKVPLLVPNFVFSTFTPSLAAPAVSSKVYLSSLAFTGNTKRYITIRSLRI